MDYPEFQRRLAQIKGMGYVQSHRKGDTGIGKTLEDLLGITENNIAGPDFATYELKSARKDTPSMITLFTKAPRPRAVNTILRETYGHMVKVEIEASTRHRHSDKDKNQTTLFGERATQSAKDVKFIEDLELHTTVDAVRYNNLDFKIDIGEDKISLLNKKNIEVYWDKELLKTTFEEKYHKLAYVLAESKTPDGKEYFWFNEGYLLDGFSFERFTEHLQDGTLKVDVRLGHNPDGSRHDHGTGFRIMERYLPHCFKQVAKMSF